MKLQVGEYVEARKPVFSLVEKRDVWVAANLKETQLTHVRVGQPATLTLDAYPDREWTATVDAISAATGAEFALLPPQNATGNWVKVVQRVPVILRIGETPDGPDLRPGMTAAVSIDTGHQRETPRIVQSLLEWVGAARAN